MNKGDSTVAVHTGTNSVCTFLSLYEKGWLFWYTVLAHNHTHR